MKVFLTGGGGMLGKSLLRLAVNYAPNWSIYAPKRSEVDLLSRSQVRKYIEKGSFDLVIHGAAKVGGIKANMADPTAFIADNLLINTHVIEESRLGGIAKFIFLGSSCMYPRNLERKLKEEDILTAPLEPTNEGYALSKISGSRHCAYISAQYNLAYKTFIPCNLYGMGDHFDAQESHLIAAIILKLHQAVQKNEKTVEIWGDGMARREFMAIDDLSKFLLTCTDKLQDMPDNLNVGIGIDHSVNEYYEAVAEIVGYKDSFVHNLDAPVGMQRKLMDSSKAGAYGWNPSTSLKDGIKQTYDYFLSIQNKAAA